VNLSFWTITLPGWALEQLSLDDLWPTFQDRIRKELGRNLSAAGIEPQLVAVVELQPKRTRREGRPCPHLHIVFRGRHHRWAPWALDPLKLDVIIMRSLRTCGVEAPDGDDDCLAQAGNVQQVKKSVRAYLACYLTRKACEVAPHVGGPWENLLPRQWWFWSKPMKREVDRHCFRLHLPFLLWVHEHREALSARGMIGHRRIDIPDPRAPRTWEIDWLDCDHLAAVVSAWQTDDWDIGWHRSYAITPCLP
jgi:hypothetical protein